MIYARRERDGVAVDVDDRIARVDGDVAALRQPADERQFRQQRGLEVIVHLRHSLLEEQPFQAGERAAGIKPVETFRLFAAHHQGGDAGEAPIVDVPGVVFGGARLVVLQRSAGAIGLQPLKEREAYHVACELGLHGGVLRSLGRAVQRVQRAFEGCVGGGVAPAHVVLAAPVVVDSGDVVAAVGRQAARIMVRRGMRT